MDQTRFLTLSLINICLGQLTGGIALGQCATYLSLTKNARIYKCFIGALMFFSLLTNLLYIVDTIERYAQGFGDFGAQSILKPSAAIAVICTGLTIGLVLSFYTYRAWILANRSPYVLALLCPLVVASAVGDIWLGSYQIYVGNIVQVVENLGWRAGLVFILPAIADAAITGTMLFCLWRSQKLEVSELSYKVIRRVMMISLETNVFTTLIQIIALIFYLTTQDLHILLVASLPQIYIATVLFWLIARLQTRAIINKSSAEEASGKVISGTSPTSRLNFPPSGVHVSTTRSLHVDTDNRNGVPASSYSVELDDLESEKTNSLRFDRV